MTMMVAAMACPSRGHREVVFATNRGDLYVGAGAHVRLVARLGAPPVALCASPPAHDLHQVTVTVSLRDAECSCCVVALASGELIARLAGHHRLPVHALAQHARWNLAASASPERLVVWNSALWTKRKSLAGGRSGGIVAVAFAAWGGETDLVVVAFRDGKMLGWDARDFRLLLSLAAAAPALTCFAAAPHFIVAAHRNQLFLFERASEGVVVDCACSSLVQVECVDGGVLALGDDGVLRECKRSSAAVIALSFVSKKPKKTAVVGFAVDAVTGDVVVRLASGLLERVTLRRRREDARRTPDQRLVRATRALTGNESILNKARLGKLLNHAGEFPEKYRRLCWRFLLQLPKDSDAYRRLEQGRGVLRALQGEGEVELEMELDVAAALPWIRFFGPSDEVSAFETVKTLMLHGANLRDFDDDPDLDWLVRADHIVMATASQANFAPFKYG